MEKLLLEHIYSLYELNTDYKTWSETIDISNPPRYYRLQMITSILNALNIDSNYASFFDGNFIVQNNQINMLELIRIIEKNHAFILSNFSIPDSAHIHELKYLFKKLINYRLDAQLLLSCNAGVLAASNFYTLPLRITNSINTNLAKELKIIDQILSYIINPNGIAYTKDLLIEQFNYPNIDLDEVDIDYM